MIKTFNPDFKNTITQRLQQQSFLKHVGFEITNITEGRITGELNLQQHHLQQMGFVHGGLSATIADTVAGFAAVTLVPPQHHVVTVELKVSYLNPGVGEKIIAHGWVLKQGRKLNFCEAEIFCIKGSGEPVLIAKASATMATISPEDIIR